MDDRAFMINVKVKRKHWFRDDEYLVEITDGQNTISLDNGLNSIFVMETDKHLNEKILYAGTSLPWQQKAGE